MRCRLALAAGCLVAFCSLSLPLSVGATDDLPEDELDAWLSAAMVVVSDPDNANLISNAPAWYCSLQYLNYALHENDQMIHASDTWANLSPGYAYYYNDAGDLCGLMFPTNYDTNAHYDSVMLCSGSDFSLYLSCSTDAPAYESYVQYNGYYSGSNALGYTCISTGSGGASRYNFTVTCEGSYFNTLPWTITLNQYALSYSVNLTMANIVPSVPSSYAPAMYGYGMQLSVGGNYSNVNLSSLNLADIGLTQLFDYATLHDYITDDWLPAFQAANPGITLDPVPEGEAPEDPIYDDQDITLGIPRSWTQTNIRVPSIPSLTLDLPEADYQQVDDSPIAANLSGVMFWWELLNQILTLSATKALVLTFFILGIVLYVLWNLGR